jgi:hypothetical protein
VALEEYILGGVARKEALELAGTMHWDPEFAGWELAAVTPAQRNAPPFRGGIYGVNHI